MTIDIRPVTACLGAEVAGIDLEQDIPDKTAEEIRQALWKYKVLFFRDQHLDDEHQLTLARVFGEPEVHPIRQALGSSETLHDIVDSEDSAPDRDGWHTDVTYMPRPPGEAVVRAEVMPAYGGDTMWVDMVAALESLSEPVRQLVEGRRAFHAADARFLDYIRKHLPEEVLEKVMAAVGQGAEHPLVRTHPASGEKSLFVDKAYMSRIVGLSDTESDWLKDFLLRLSENPNWQCRFHWRAGDVVVWDERTTQHFGVADHRGSDRVLRRCVVAGEVPF